MPPAEMTLRLTMPPAKVAQRHRCSGACGVAADEYGVAAGGDQFAVGDAAEERRQRGGAAGAGVAAGENAGGASEDRAAVDDAARERRHVFGKDRVRPGQEDRPSIGDAAGKQRYLVDLDGGARVAGGLTIPRLPMPPRKVVTPERTMPSPN